MSRKHSGDALEGWHLHESQADQKNQTVRSPPPHKNKFKPFLVTAIVVIVTVAIVNRIAALRSIVYPA